MMRMSGTMVVEIENAKRKYMPLEYVRIGNFK